MLHHLILLLGCWIIAVGWQRTEVLLQSQKRRMKQEKEVRIQILSQICKKKCEITLKTNNIRLPMKLRISQSFQNSISILNDKHHSSLLTSTGDIWEKISTPPSQAVCLGNGEDILLSTLKCGNRTSVESVVCWHFLLCVLGWHFCSSVTVVVVC